MTNKWVKKPFDAQNFKCRCSAIKSMMSEKQGFATLTEKQIERVAAYEKELSDRGCLAEGKKKELAEMYAKREKSKEVVLSDTCIEYLMAWYSWETEGMIPVGKESLDILAIQKGKEAEVEAVALLSIYDSELYLTHKGRIENKFLSGQIDCYLGEGVYSAKRVADIKNAFDYPTFLKKKHTGLENGQEEQLQGYGDITGARELCVANTLITASDAVIDKMKWKVAEKMNALTIESPEFLEEWGKWHRSMVFSEMNPKKRVSKIPIEPFSEIRRQQVYDKVQVCRDWLHNFHESYSKLS